MADYLWCPIACTRTHTHARAHTHTRTHTLSLSLSVKLTETHKHTYTQATVSCLYLYALSWNCSWSCLQSVDVSVHRKVGATTWTCSLWLPWSSSAPTWACPGSWLPQYSPSTMSTAWRRSPSALPQENSPSSLESGQRLKLLWSDWWTPVNVPDPI